jgi:hypothetical protein
MIVKEYTEDFYRLNIKTGKRERDKEIVTKYEIQDELSMMLVRTMEYAYQFALKAEEEVKARSQAKARDLTVTKHISLRTRLRNHTIT